MSTQEIFKPKKAFKLENGKSLKNLEIAYQTFGKLNSDKSNVIWVCHALTANTNVLEWWKGLFGENELFNPKEHFIICANVLSSCYGSSSPLHANPVHGNPYYTAFPQVTIRDIVLAHQLLAKELGIHQIQVLIGGSLGGQQALEWSIIDPPLIKNLIILATNANHSPFGIAFNESQRLAISADRTFYADKADGGLKGLKVARSIALLSYRTYQAYNTTQTESVEDKTDNFRAASYQNHQGEKLCKRFNAYSYWYLTKAMDSHNVARGRKSKEHALESIKANTLVIGIESDCLFPLSEQKYLASHIQDASLVSIQSTYGHDGFLIETQQLTHHISDFLKRTANNNIISLNKTA